LIECAGVAHVFNRQEQRDFHKAMLAANDRATGLPISSKLHTEHVNITGAEWRTNRSLRDRYSRAGVRVEGIQNLTMLAAATRHEQCVALGDVLSVLKVECSFNRLLITFDSEVNAQNAIESWFLRRGTNISYFNVPAEYLCINSVAGRAAVVNRKVKAGNQHNLPYHWINQTVVEIETEDTQEDMSFSCFRDISIKFELIYQHPNDSLSPLTFNNGSSSGRRLLATTDLVPLNPTYGSSLNPGDSVLLSWQFASSIASRTVRITLYQDLVAEFDTNYGSITCDVSLGCSFPLPANLPSSIEPYYFFYNWDTSLSDSFCVNYCTSGAKWNVPYTSVSSWNYDAAGQRALSPQFLFNEDCNTLCPNGVAPSGVSSWICQMCGQGRSVTANIQCTNCFYNLDYSVMQFNLDRSALVLNRFDMRVHGSGTAAIHIDADASFDGSFTKTLQVLNVSPLPWSLLSVSIAGVSVSIDATLGIQLQASLTLNATASVSVGATYVANFDASVEYLSTGTFTSSGTGSLVKQYDPPSFLFRGYAALDLAIIPSVNLSIASFAYAAVRSEIYATLRTAFQYPGFSINQSPQDLGGFELSFPPDACSRNHLLIYDVLVGVRNTQIAYAMFVSVSSLNVLNYPLTVYYPSAMVLGPFQVLRGCLFPVSDASGTPQSQVTTLPLNYVPASFDSFFVQALLRDLSIALGVSVSFIMVQQWNVYIGETIITLDFFPGSPYSPEELVNALYSQRIYRSPSLMNGLITQYAAGLDPSQISSSSSTADNSLSHEADDAATSSSAAIAIGVGVSVSVVGLCVIVWGSLYLWRTRRTQSKSDTTSTAMPIRVKLLSYFCKVKPTPSADFTASAATATNGKDNPSRIFTNIMGPSAVASAAVAPPPVRVETCAAIEMTNPLPSLNSAEVQKFVRISGEYQYNPSTHPNSLSVRDETAQHIPHPKATGRITAAHPPPLPVTAPGVSLMRSTNSGAQHGPYKQPIQQPHGNCAYVNPSPFPVVSPHMVSSNNLQPFATGNHVPYSHPYGPRHLSMDTYAPRTQYHVDVNTLQSRHLSVDAAYQLKHPYPCTPSGGIVESRSLTALTNSRLPPLPKKPTTRVVD
jgi:hypothetical protein